MRALPRATALLALAVVAWVSCPRAALAASARTAYEAARAREQTLRRAGSPALKQYRAVIAAYEAVVRRYPATGYADNSLWQAAMIGFDAHSRFADERDRQRAIRLLRTLIEEYPSSSLVARARAEIRRAAMPASPAAPPRAVAPPRAAAAPPSPAGPNLLRAVRRDVTPEGVRVTIELDREVMYRSERVENPPRLLFDLAGTHLGQGVDEGTTSFQDDIVRHVKIGRHPNDVTRVVLDLVGAAGFEVFTLYEPYRLIVDCPRAVVAPVPSERIREETLPPLVPADAPGAPSAPPSAKPAVPAVDVTPARTDAATDKPLAPEPLRNGYSLARQLGLAASRVIIDPGHGGRDPGALGQGAAEAAVVLDVALRLERLLTKAGIEVVLTRRTDEYVPLEERTRLANQEQGDLFISIHANASRNRSAEGVETYVLNFASNPEAEAVAARENAASGRTMSNLPEIVRAITLNNKLDESRSLAGSVQKELVKQLRGTRRQLRDHGVKQAPFVVLIGAVMPSVLVEVSFITHRQEGRLLKSPSYRQRVADGLFEGIRGYQRSLKRAEAVSHQ